MNKEGRACAELVELTILASHATAGTGKVFQVMLNNIGIHRLELTLQANK